MVINDDSHSHKLQYTSSMITIPLIIHYQIHIVIN